MWVKLTPDELLKASQRRKRQHILTTFYVTIGCFLMLMFLEGQIGMLDTASFFVPPGAIYERIPSSFIFSIIFGFVFYFFKKEKPSFVCIKCGKPKVSDTSSKCE